TNGRDYLYQVAGFDGVTLGGLDSLTVIPSVGPPVVQPVTIQNIHANAIDLFWGVPVSSFPVSFYRISEAVLPFTPTPASTPNAFNSAAVTLAVPVATVFGTSYTDTSGPGAAYYVVQAVDNNGVTSALPVTATGPGVP